MQDGLEVVALPRVLAVKQVEKLEDELVVHVLLGHLGVRIARHDIPQQQLVHQRQMRPRRLKLRLLLVHLRALHRPAHLPMPPRRQFPKQIPRDHPDHRRRRLLRKLPRPHVHVVHEVLQRLPLNLLLPHLLDHAREIIHHRTQLQLLQEDVLLRRGRQRVERLVVATVRHRIAVAWPHDRTVRLCRCMCRARRIRRARCVSRARRRILDDVPVARHCLLPLPLPLPLSSFSSGRTRGSRGPSIGPIRRP